MELRIANSKFSSPLSASETHPPIGIFDSGLGGLSVFRLLPALLPAERFVYVADSGRAPYGPRPQEEIIEFSEEIVEYLIDVEQCKVIVIACNTATAAAADVLRKRYPKIPIIGMEPAVKPAAQATISGKVGVMATAGTFGSERYAELMSQYGRDIEVIEDPCVGLVTLIEEGELSSPRLSAKLETIVTPMIEAGVDTIVLGCTHFPLVQEAIAETAGEGVTIIDPAPAVARQLVRVLETEELLADPTDNLLSFRQHTVLTSGDLIRLIKALHSLLDPETAEGLLVSECRF
ncbi:MAG: glutamate racemase [Saprospiraceae bacterium]